jgi:putative flippase GtrA
MTKKLWELKIFRFLCVGVINTVIDLTILNILAFIFHIPALIANLFSASISISFSYFLNHHLVFRINEDHSVKKFVRFFAVTGFGILAIQSLVIYLVVHLLRAHRVSVKHFLSGIHLHISPQVFELNTGKIIAIIIAMAWNFKFLRL